MKSPFSVGCINLAAYRTKTGRTAVLLITLTASSLAQPAPQVTATPSSAAAAAGRQLSPAETREAQLAADTERLYKLAQELKVELDKTTKDTLSLTVVKKAAEIEKLAHSISERMKTR